MKLWDSLTTCLILLSAVYVAASLRSRRHAARRRRTARAAENPLEQPPVQGRVSAPASPGTGPTESDAGARRSTMEEPPPDDLDGVVDFIRRSISRLQRTSSTSTTPSLTLPSVTASSSAKNGRRTRRRKNGRKVDKGGGLRPSRVRAVTKVRRGGRPRGRGCALRQVHLNVTDLGLGYYSSEEMIFRYCSGPCRKSETNYDRILQNLAHNGRFSRKDTPARACCRPIAFDDDLSFLDDNLVYHTVRKHSARKCGCV